MRASELRKILRTIQADPRYQRNIQYGEPRSGHPEGTVQAHIQDLDRNLELLKPRLRSELDYWKLKLLIHIHDSFKAESIPDIRIIDPRSHASLARQYASQFITDTDLLNMIQFHDKNYALWLQYAESGAYDERELQDLLETIKDWDLFLAFTIVDGCTRGKDRSKLAWFIDEVRKHKQTCVDSTWILPPPSET